MMLALLLGALLATSAPGGAGAAPSHQPRAVAGGFVRAYIQGISLKLAITRESGWGDLGDPKPSCLKTPSGDRAVNFDINWSAASQKATLPDAHISVADSHGQPMTLAPEDGGCVAFTHRDFPRSQPTSQWAYAGVVFLRGQQKLGALRIHIDGHRARLTLVHGCDPFAVGTDAYVRNCFPHPTLRIS
jgi:hypothetical protein